MNSKQMVHMFCLEIWEWGLKIFDGAPTLITHMDHLLYNNLTVTQNTNLTVNLDYVDSNNAARATVTHQGDMYAPTRDARATDHNGAIVCGCA